jgi:putative ABC transport system permease protein
VEHLRSCYERDALERGLSPDAARREASLALGGATQLRETARGFGWERRVAEVGADLRFAMRRLRGDPGFSLVAILTIAVGIGSATAIYSAVRPVLFESLPYPDADHVRMIVERDASGLRTDGTFGMFRGLQDGVRSFSALSVVASWRPTAMGGERPERLSGQRVSAAYFDVLGVPPARGRTLSVSEDRAGGPAVVIISDALWQRRFGARPDVIGQTMLLDGVSHEVIGVMPRGFENVTAPDAEVWTALQYDLAQGRAWGRHLTTLGRLRDGVSAEAAAVEVNTIGDLVLREQQPPTYGAQVSWSIPSLQEDSTRDVRPALLAIVVAVGILLLLVCVNVTNLLIVRAGRRREEFALRAALGASRGRLVRQVLIESLVLSAFGGAFGVAVASWGLDAIVAVSPVGLPRVATIALNGGVLVFALVTTALSGLAFGLLPALQASSQDRLAIDLASTRVVGGSRRQLQGSLVATQVAMAIVLITGSMLLLRSMQHLLAVSPGFDPNGVLTMQLPATARRFDDPRAVVRHFDALLESARRVPGVSAVALTSQLPMSGDHDAYGVHLERPPEVVPDDAPEILRYAVSPGYLEVMGIPLRSGRTLTPADHGDAPWAIVVSESYARRYFPRGDALGQRLRVGPQDGPAYTIVGIAGDVKHQSLAGETPDAVYMTPAQLRFAETTMSLVVRSTMPPTALVPAMREAIWSVDRDQPIVRVSSLAELVEGTSTERRFVLLLFQLFAASALVLTAVGIYGMMSGLVAERTREFGLRAAVGATAMQIVALVLRNGGRMIALGAVAGVIVALAGSRLITALLFGVSHLDLLAYTGALLLVALVATCASALPAWRAAHIDPATALRT